ncbi:hypothetical protein [Defluviitalea phaphyphila]|uniref:hypothetical protein n=1 Tax=Defluviitalea phaphyphila TaxID=1473580 RepID=UPI000731A62D|nr:hypothetical protein [Defluviitalea phaphyphila]
MMDFSKYIGLVSILQILTVISFGVGIISILFLAIRIHYFKKSLYKWIKERRRLSKDPVIDRIIKLYRDYKEKNLKKINTKGIINTIYYKQKIFFIPIYYWEEFISKSEILCLFLGLVGTFILISSKKDNSFFPIILGTIFFIILILLDAALSLEKKRKIMFIQLEEYLDNTYFSNIEKTPVTSEVLKEEKTESSIHSEEEKNKDEIKEELNDEEIQWIIDQFYREEKEV